MVSSSPSKRLENLSPQTRLLAVLELTLAGAFWGFGFTATVWALRGMGPLSVTGWRFAAASLVGLILGALGTFIRGERSKSVPSATRSDVSHRKLPNQFWLAALPGGLISFTLLFQTWGLVYTTATKSAFITTLYVLLVPVFERFILRRRLPRYHLVYVCLAMIGVALICDLEALFTNAISEERSRLNFGDLLTLACAITATLHILLFGAISEKIGSAFRFNTYQSFWAALLPLSMSFLFEPRPQLSFSDFSLVGILSLTFGSTLIAFALQVRAQKRIAPSLASLLFLLESPFSALFTFVFLNEVLNPTQWIGAMIILVSAALCALGTRRSRSTLKSSHQKIEHQW